MPVFRCEKCGCLENTAVCNYWHRGKKPALCSGCDPEIGKWHNRFPKRQYKKGDDVLNPPKEKSLREINHNCTTAKMAEQLNVSLWKVMELGRYFKGIEKARRLTKKEIDFYLCNSCRKMGVTEAIFKAQKEKNKD